MSTRHGVVGTDKEHGRGVVESAGRQVYLTGAHAVLDKRAAFADATRYD